MKGTELLKIIHSSVIVVYISKPCSQDLEPNKNKRWVNGKRNLTTVLVKVISVENDNPILIYPEGLCVTEACLKKDFNDSQ